MAAENLPLRYFPLTWNRRQPTPPPGHPQDHMLRVAGWGSGPEPDKWIIL